MERHAAGPMRPLCHRLPHVQPNVNLGSHVLTGHLEQSLGSSLQNYVPQYEEDVDESNFRKPAAMPQNPLQRDAADRHAGSRSRFRGCCSKEVPLRKGPLHVQHDADSGPFAPTGHLEQSLVSSLRTYAPQYEEDADEGDPRDPAAVPQHAFQQESAARHAALTEQAQRLMQQERPSVTDLRMYNMMMTRESILQVRVFYASSACCQYCVLVSKLPIRRIAAAELLEQLRLCHVIKCSLAACERKLRPWSEARVSRGLPGMPGAIILHNFSCSLSRSQGMSYNWKTCLAYLELGNPGSQAMRDGVSYAEARVTANAEDAARRAAQDNDEGPETTPPFREMMQRLDRVACLFICLGILPAVPVHD